MATPAVELTQVTLVAEQTPVEEQLVVEQLAVVG
jgi:hypothetical protein